MKARKCQRGRSMDDPSEHGRCSAGEVKLAAFAPGAVEPHVTFRHSFVPIKRGWNRELIYGF
jgi:hypothetical protein